MDFNEKLLDIIACPVDKQPLQQISPDQLLNPRLGLLYPIVDGIPVLLREKATKLKENEK